MQDLTLVFDFGGVLIEWDPRHLYRRLFDGDEEAMAYFLSHICTPAWNAELDAGRSFAEAVRERSAAYPAYAPYIAAYYEQWTEMVAGAIEGTVEILTRLREAGYRLCALSNWSAETFPLVQQQFAFLKWFEVVVLSGEVKLVKPDPAIYEVLLDRIDREAGACLFIDDNAPNIEAASAMGFQTIHFQSPAQLLRDLQKRGLLA